MKAHFSAEVVDGGRVFLVAEDSHYYVQGADAAAVLPYLDGRRSVADIAAALAADLPLPRVFAALQRYQAAGHLAEGRPDLPDGELAYWDAAGVDANAVAALAGRPVVVRALGAADAAPVAEALAARGLRAVGPDAGDATVAELCLAVVDDYLEPELAAVNAARLGDKRPWLIARPAGLTAWIGPLLIPGRTGCWSCLAQRVQENRQVERYLSRKRGDTVPRSGVTARTGAAAATSAAMLATEAVRFLVTGDSALAGRMVTLDLRTLTLDEHALVRRPQCAACGDPGLIAKRDPRITLSRTPAAHTTDGGYRTRSPQATYTRLKHHISPYLGAISRLGAHEENDEGGIAYSFTAGHNFAMVNDNMDLLRRNMRGQSGGKGRTEIQAKVSAICEAVERYSGLWRPGEPVVHAAYDDLDPGTAVHMDQLLGFSEAQFAVRDTWNADPLHRLHLVPEPFRTELDLDWTRAWSLTADAERLVPSGFAWFGHPDIGRHFFCVSDSNGGAAGNTREEAILQGFCEVAERDAVAVWWYNRLRRPAFDLDSLQDPYIDALRAFYAGMDRTLWVLDITSDLGVPTFAAVSGRRHAVQDVMVGFGAHPDPAIAAVRALTEVNQFLPFVGRRDADGATVYQTDDVETLRWCREAKIEAEPWLSPDPDRPATTLADHRRPDGDDLAGHVRHCVERARAIGVEVMVVDQTQPDLELSVVKVIAPGLRHFWRRLGPGRLYDSPVRQGYLAAPLPEEQMNPWNVFF